MINITKEARKEQFSQMIQRKAVDEDSNCIEAIVAFCEESGMEIEMVKNLIDANLKAKIESEAQSLRLISGNSASLPL
jgi:hypothetical protein